MPRSGISENFRELLRSELLRRTKSNPAYSVRAFANQLDIDHSSLAKILRGQLPLGTRIISRLGKQLGYSNEEVSQLVDEDYLENHQKFLNIAEDHFAIISDWYHYAILCLTELPNFKPSAAWISKTLSIPLDEAKSAVKRLKKLDFLRTDKDKWIDNTGGKTTNLSETASSRARRQHQRQVLEMAIEAVEEVDPQYRSQTSMTVTVDMQNLDKARKLIKKFRRQMTELLDPSSTATEVFHLSVSLYPLTHFYKITKQGENQ